MFFFWYPFSGVRSNWFDWSNLFNIRMMFNHLNVSIRDVLSIHLPHFLPCLLKSTFLWRFRWSTRNFPRFSMPFFVPNSLYAVCVQSNLAFKLSPWQTTDTSAPHHLLWRYVQPHFLKGLSKHPDGAIGKKRGRFDSVRPTEIEKQSGYKRQSRRSCSFCDSERSIRLRRWSARIWQWSGCRVTPRKIV